MKKQAIFALIVFTFLGLSLPGFSEAKKKARAAAPESGAGTSWMTSYNEASQFNLYAVAGVGFSSLTASLGGEYVIGEFNIDVVPLQWGVMVRGILGYNTSYGDGEYLDWGVAPMVSLHWCTDWGQHAGFEFYAAVGLGLDGGVAHDNSGVSSPLGVASSVGLGWYFSDSMALVLDFTHIGYTNCFSLGVKINL
jgi:hypothetical protein